MSRKKSIAAHVANSTFRPSVHGPRPGTVLAQPAVKPRKPKLKRDAGRAWDELAALLSDRLRPEDSPQLEQASVWLAKWRSVAVALDRVEPGSLQFARLVSALSTTSKSFDRIARKFGMSCLDRDALNMPAAADDGIKRWA
jgi:hypothetical protein